MLNRIDESFYISFVQKGLKYTLKFHIQTFVEAYAVLFFVIQFDSVLVGLKPQK